MYLLTAVWMMFFRDVWDTVDESVAIVQVQASFQTEQFIVRVRPWTLNRVGWIRSEHCLMFTQTAHKRRWYASGVKTVSFSTENTPAWTKLAGHMTNAVNTPDNYLSSSHVITSQQHSVVENCLGIHPHNHPYNHAYIHFSPLIQFRVIGHQSIAGPT